jgi:hypothetical protein
MLHQQATGCVVCEGGLQVKGVLVSELQVEVLLLAALVVCRSYAGAL